MGAPVVVILAAGQGTRMRSRTPKLLHELCGRPMIAWPVAAAQEAGASKVIVVDAPGRPLAPHLSDSVVVVVQEHTLGTADAVKVAVPEIDPDQTVLVLYGDVPLLSADTIKGLAEAHDASGARATVTTTILDDPTGWGRVVRAADGSVEKIVETRKPGDATPEEMLIREVNTGIYAFNGAALLSALDQIGNDNSQAEYYLTDAPMIIRAAGGLVTVHQLKDAGETFNVNDRVQLTAVRGMLQRRIHERHMLAGVTIISPETTFIDAGVTLAEDVTIQPGTSLRGNTSVGEGSTIGPHSTLQDVTVGEGSKVIQSHAVDVGIADGVSVGPFSYLRPGTVLRDGSKAGSFVEIKNSEVGERSKVPHLSYIGDTTIGEDVNLGASTITANYDGYQKHRTTIGDRVHTSVDTTLVAPVQIGDDAHIGAGSVITDDVPDGALGIARPRQTVIDGYDEKLKTRHRSKEPDQTEAS